MQIIIISPNNTSHRHWHISRRKMMLLTSCSLLFLVAIAFLIHHQFSLNFLEHPPVIMTQTQSTDTPDQAQTTIASESTQQEANHLEDYYAKRLGQLQAESIRLTALTEKLAEIAGIDTSEYSLNDIPAQGGIDEHGESLSPDAFSKEMSLLTKKFDQQGQQLASLQNLFITRDNIKSAIPQGRPVKGGFLSSAYGYRIDPFNGKKTFHSGIDFAAKEGSKVIAVADGLVSFTGKRNGYGQIVEIDHGNGYVTRYAHNKKIVVKQGDRIKKGETIALMGSTGRSTGPHVHFEVLREGEKINPFKFIKRKS